MQDTGGEDKKFRPGVISCCKSNQRKSRGNGCEGQWRAGNHTGEGGSNE